MWSPSLGVNGNSGARSRARLRSAASGGALVEGRLDHAGLDGAAAAVDEQLGPHRAHRRRDVAEPDVLAHGGPRAPAGAHAHADALLVLERIAVAGDAPPHHLEADQPARRA